MKRHFTQISIIICLIIALSVFFGCGSGTTENENEDKDDVYDTRPVVCFGDSLTYGTGASRGQSYPDFLQKQIRVDVINAGVNGGTTAGGLARINKDVLEKNPQLVIIGFGGNDLFNGVTVEQIKSNLEQMITRINSDNGNRKIYIANWIPVSAIDNNALLIVNVLRLTNGASLLTPKELSDFVADYRTALVSLSAAHDVEIVNGIFEGIYSDSNLMSDPLHPNSRGYEKMANNYLKAIRPYLQDNNLLKK